VLDVGQVKKREGKQIEDLRRESAILRRQLRLAKKLGLDMKLMERFLSVVFRLAKSVQKKIA
jgi:chorismate mutase